MSSWNQLGHFTETAVLFTRQPVLTPSETDHHAISHGFGRQLRIQVTDMEVHHPFVSGISLRIIVS